MAIVRAQYRHLRTIRESIYGKCGTPSLRCTPWALTHWLPTFDLYHAMSHYYTVPVIPALVVIRKPCVPTVKSVPETEILHTEGGTSDWEWEGQWGPMRVTLGAHQWRACMHSLLFQLNCLSCNLLPTPYSYTMITTFSHMSITVLALCNCFSCHLKYSTLKHRTYFLENVHSSFTYRKGTAGP